MPGCSHASAPPKPITLISDTDLNPLLLGRNILSSSFFLRKQNKTKRKKKETHPSLLFGSGRLWRLFFSSYLLLKRTVKPLLSSPPAPFCEINQSKNVLSTLSPVPLMKLRHHCLMLRTAHSGTIMLNRQFVFILKVWKVCASVMMPHLKICGLWLRAF